MRASQRGRRDAVPSTPIWDQSRPGATLRIFLKEARRAALARIPGRHSRLRGRQMRAWPLQPNGEYNWLSDGPCAADPNPRGYGVAEERPDPATMAGICEP